MGARGIGPGVAQGGGPRGGGVRGVEFLFK